MSTSEAITADSSNLLGMTCGHEFLDELLLMLQKETSADLLLIGSMRAAENDRVKVHAWFHADGNPKIEEYDACTLPCIEVLRSGQPVVVCGGMRERYPDDPVLPHLGIESYVGVPLIAADGTVIGLLLAEWFREITEGIGEKIIRTFQSFSKRVCHEVSSILSVETLESSAIRTLSAPAQNFGQLANTLCLSMKVRAVYLTEWTDCPGGHFRVLAFSIDGKDQDVPKDLRSFAETPCGGLLAAEDYLVSADLHQAFPNANIPGPDGVDSYFGARAHGPDGSVMGHIVLLHDRPISTRIRKSPLFGLFLARAGIELQSRSAICEQERLREALHKKDRHESLGLYASGLVHDLNNLLYPLATYLELARAAQSINDVQQHISNTEKCVQTAAEFTDTLMHSVRGNCEEAAPCDVSRLVDAVVLLLSARLSPERITTNIQDALPRIRVDQIQIRRVLLNILTNAADSLDDNGTITIEGFRGPADENLTVKADNLSDDCVVLKVSDNGYGMPAEILTRIFEPYFTTKKDGAGVGMPAVRRILERHGAGLKVESQVGHGTSLSIYFAVPVEGQDPANS